MINVSRQILPCRRGGMHFDPFVVANGDSRTFYKWDLGERGGGTDCHNKGTRMSLQDGHTLI